MVQSNGNPIGITPEQSRKLSSAVAMLDALRAASVINPGLITATPKGR